MISTFITLPMLYLSFVIGNLITLPEEGENIFKSIIKRFLYCVLGVLSVIIFLHGMLWFFVIGYLERIILLILSPVWFVLTGKWDIYYCDDMDDLDFKYKNLTKKWMIKNDK